MRAGQSIDCPYTLAHFLMSKMAIFDPFLRILTILGYSDLMAISVDKMVFYLLLWSSYKKSFNEIIFIRISWRAQESSSFQDPQKRTQKGPFMNSGNWCVSLNR